MSTIPCLTPFPSITVEPMRICKAGVSIPVIGAGFTALVIVASMACKPADEPTRKMTRSFAAPMTDVVRDLDAWLHADDAHLATQPAPEVVKEIVRPRPSVQAVDAYLTRADAHLKKLQLDDAIRMYRAALNEAPGRLDAYYGLARTHAARRKKTLALASLQKIKDANTAQGKILLRQARVAPAFKAYRDSGKFRAITGFMPVTIARGRRSSASEVDRVIKRLRKAYIIARPGRKWRGKQDETTVFYAKGSRLARSTAREVAAALALPPRVLPSRYLKANRPVVLVLTEARAQEDANRRFVRDYFGLTLEAREGQDVHTLVLQKTGGFRWELTRGDGSRRVRYGRYHIASTRISFSFASTHFAKDGSKAPTQHGRRISTRVKLRAASLFVGPLRFVVKGESRP